MATVDILVEGYVKEVKGGELVRTTCSLVQDGGVKLIVDPGLMDTPQLLIDALASHHLQPQDITHVFVTHWHIDHVRYLGLFSKATVYDGLFCYQGENWSDHAGDGLQITPDIQIVQTPGHTAEDSSLLVRTSEGTVAMTHVWWFANKTPIADPLATDLDQLTNSRSKIESLADWVIPPHGPKFKLRP